MEKINFQKSEIDKSKFGEINKIFVEKTVNQIADYACIAVYRDILIFKKQNKTVGIAKICFECFKKQIIGTNANTENFGQDGDYEKLEKILKKHKISFRIISNIIKINREKIRREYNKM